MNRTSIWYLAVVLFFVAGIVFLVTRSAGLGAATFALALVCLALAMRERGKQV